MYFVRHDACFRQRLFNFFPALHKSAQIFQALRQFAQQLIVQRAGGFLAIAGDKRDGVSGVQQLNDGLHLTGLERKFFCEYGNKIHDIDSFDYSSSSICRGLSAAFTFPKAWAIMPFSSIR